MTNDADGGESPSGSEVTCAAVPVDVEGKQAVWIFTEFETDESLKTLRDWLIPDHWPEWGGEMFKEMKPIGSLDLRPTPGGAHQIHSNYLEVVEIGGHRLETELRCEVKSAKKWAATSFDLDRSIGDMLQVDRGYLMVADVGGRRHVKALKVVGFTNTLLNTVATQVCPEWSTWVQRATQVERGPGRRGHDRPETRLDRRLGSQGVRGPARAPRAFTGGVAEQWIGTVTDMVDFYAPFTVDVGERFWSGRTSGWTPRTTPAASSSASPAIGRVAWQAGTESIANWAEVTVRPTSGRGSGQERAHRRSTRR